MIRLYTKNDYELISTWMKKRNIKHLTEDSFSTIGYIANNCIVGFLYTTDSSISFIDTFISDPDSDKEQRSKSIDLVIKALTSSAKNMKAKYIMVTVMHETLNDHFKNNGFNTISDKSKCLVGVL